MIWQDIMVCNFCFFTLFHLKFFYTLFNLNFVYELIIISNNVDTLRDLECGNLKSEGSF